LRVAGMPGAAPERHELDEFAIPTQ
jgi:hypothetical protein